MSRSAVDRVIGAFLFAGILALVPGTAGAQAVVPGDTIRITSFNWRYEGMLMSVDSASLLMHSDKGDTLRFFRADISSASVLRGRHGSRMATVGKGALIGLGVGTTLAGASLLDDSGNQESREMRGVFAVICVVFGTATGTVVGAIVSLTQLDHWEQFDPHPPSMLTQPRESSGGELRADFLTPAVELR